MSLGVGGCFDHVTMSRPPVWVNFTVSSGLLLLPFPLSGRAKGDREGGMRRTSPLGAGGCAQSYRAARHPARKTRRTE